MSGLEGMGVVLPGLVVAAAAVIVFVLGLRMGSDSAKRRDDERGAELEEALRALGEGRYDAIPDLPAGHPDADLAAAVGDLGRKLARRESAGKASGARVGAALEAFRDRAILLLGPELEVTLASGAADALFGLGGAPIEGCGLDQLFEGESFEGFVARLTLARRGREAVSARLAIPGGGLADVDAVWRGDGEEGVVLAARLATQEGATQAALLQRYQALLEELSTGLVIVSKGTIVEANPAARRLLGAELDGVELADLVAAEDLLLVRDRVARAAAGDDVGAFRCRLHPVETGMRDAEVEVQAVSTLDGVALAMLDLGAQRAAEGRASAHEARLLAVFDAVVDGLAMLGAPATEGAPWRVALVNRGFRELFSLDESRVLGAPEAELRALIAHLFEDPPAFAAFLAKASGETRQPHQQTFAMAGGERAVEILVRPALTSEGVVRGRILVARDVTHHRAAQSRLERDAAELSRSRESLQSSYEDLVSANETLSRRSEELDQINRHLQDLDATRSELLASTAHELQSPLVSVSGYHQMLLDGRLGRLNDEQRRGLEASLRNVERLSGLVSGLMELAKEGEPAHAEPVALDAGRALAEAIGRHEGEAHRRGVHLEGRDDAPDVSVRGEPDSLRVVLDNLIGNALKFTQSGGRVVVTLSEVPGMAAFEVRDNGPGIPPDEIERIFERFYRASSAEGVQGTGLGLATVKSTVERHNGTVECRSRVGRGTVFRVLWPLSRAGEARPPETQASSG